MTRFCVPRSARLGGRRHEMDHRRKLQSGQERASRFSVHPKIFVFFDKSTGTRLFEVTAREDGRMPQEQAVSLLAMHCVARQQMPKDFGVMVATGEDLVENLAGRAMELIRTRSEERRVGKECRSRW